MHNTLFAAKRRLRATCLARRDLMPPQARALKSRSIEAKLFGLPAVSEAACVFVYVSFRSEVETRCLIRRFLSRGQEVAVPFTDLGHRKIVPCRILDPDRDLAPGTMGIPEPVRHAGTIVGLDAIDLVIMPGAAFSRQGWRLGYGGGFYDRFLAESRLPSCALAFEVQVVSRVPCDPARDMPVDCIVTEARVIDCGAG